MKEEFYKYQKVVYDGDVFEVVETADKSGRMRIRLWSDEVDEIIWVDEEMVVSLGRAIKLKLIDEEKVDNVNAYDLSRFNNINSASIIKAHQEEVAKACKTAVGKDGSGKDDRADGKLRWDLLPLAEIEDIVRVYTEGAKKYADNSWQDIPDGFNRYLGALMRHLVAYTKGERYDKEGFMHLSAVCWNAIALLYYDKHNKGLIEWKSQEKSKRVVDEGLRAIDKRTGKYVNVIKRTIDDSLFPIVKYLSYSYNELNYDYVKNLNFDVNVNWEQRRYQIVKDLLSNDFDGRKMSIDEVDNAIFTADLIINRLTTI